MIFEEAVNDFHQMKISPKLGAEFQRTFTRMEYALKASGDFADGDANGISAAWDRFANTIDNAFCNVADKGFQAAVHFLLEEPARKQILNGFGPLFLDPKQTKAQRTLLVVRTVRNNVTHGGKIKPEGEKEVGRNERLVASSLTVLKHVAELHDKVSAKFHG
jgi:hypothetical protein